MENFIYLDKPIAYLAEDGSIWISMEDYTQKRPNTVFTAMFPEKSTITLKGRPLYLAEDGTFWLDNHFYRSYKDGERCIAEMEQHNKQLREKWEAEEEFFRDGLAQGKSIEEMRNIATERLLREAGLWDSDNLGSDKSK